MIKLIPLYLYCMCESDGAFFPITIAYEEIKSDDIEKYLERIIAEKLNDLIKDD